MKKNHEFKFLILLCLAIAVGGCGNIDESKSAIDKVKISEIEMEKIDKSVRTMSNYIGTHVSGKKQAVFYEPEIKKIIIQAELTNTEITALYAEFDKNNIKIAPIDGEFVGMMSNEKENIFGPK